MSRLLNCPFCGSNKIDEDGWVSLNTSGPACDECGGSVGTSSLTNEENVGLWNTRADTSSDAAAMACRWLEAKETLATKYAEITRLTQENERMREALKWQPIETAPKDGSDVLTWDGNDHCVLFFSQYGHGWTAGNPKVKHLPTHWMPLPITPIPDPAGGMPVEVKT